MKKDDLVSLLLSEGRLFDSQISGILNILKPRLQIMISQINSSKGKKFKEIVIIKEGEQGNLIREIISRETEENKILDNRDKRLKKGIKQIDVARKEGLIAVNTRQGIKNRNLLVNRIMQQNLNSMIEAQTILND